MARRKETRGATSHKSPNCACISCTRRRQKEAIVGSVGTGRAALAKAKTEREVIYATSNLNGVETAIRHWLTVKAIEPDITVSEAAKRIGLAPQTLYNYIHRAGKEGWLKFDSPLERVENEIVPKAVDNLVHLLEVGDKIATIETLKGTVFKTYQAKHAAQTTSQPILALKIEMVNPSEQSKMVIEGHIVGTPKVLEGEAENAIQIGETAPLSLGQAPGDSQEMVPQVREQASRGTEEVIQTEEEVNV